MTKRERFVLAFAVGFVLLLKGLSIMDAQTPTRVPLRQVTAQPGQAVVIVGDTLGLESANLVQAMAGSGPPAATLPCDWVINLYMDKTNRRLYVCSGTPGVWTPVN